MQELIKEVNPYVRDFQMICETPEEELLEGQLVISAKAKPPDAHPGRYNLQTSLSEVSILTNAHPHDLVLKVRGGGLQSVSDLNPSAMPLHFTLLFPYGTKGWDQQTTHANSNRRVTPREFFAYYMNVRDKASDYLFMSGRLFQEFLCIGWVTTENQKLNYQRQNQKHLRADTYRNIREVLDARQLELAPVTDAMDGDDHNPRIGKKVLSSSYVGGPRWYNAQFQDGMAICREYHKPDLFITMTCNPHWEEITTQLNGAAVQDRPDLVARVFKIKKDKLIEDIMKRKVFGVVPAKLWVIEFQKRGLPHVHILVILREADRLTTAAMVDETICAELPPRPEDAVTEEAREQLTRLNKVVLTNMVHGPCGEKNRNSPCMVDGKCSKNYPKPMCSNTIIDPNNSHPQYRRRKPGEGGRTAQITRGGTTYTVDNGDIVEYSPYLSLRYNCHINVVHCCSPTACKYLYKYVCKGHDRAMVRSEVEGHEARDEIAEYEDLRSVGSSEAAWHLNAFPIARKYPAVHAMRVHLEGNQQINFDEGDEEAALETGRTTELTAFFAHNGDPDVSAEDKVYQYVDMPKKYRYDQKQKKWIQRKNKSDTIGRVHSVNPIAGDVFYLRLLLHNDHCKGKTSFEDLRTVNGEVCDSFQEACTKLGLLQDDNEWHQVLTEANYIRSTKAVRELYVTIVLYCEPADPAKLFEDHWENWTDDIIREAQQKGVNLDQQQLRTMVLLDIQRRLQSREKDLRDAHLPTPTEEQLSDVEVMTGNLPVMIREELDFDTNQLKELATERYELFTEEQRHVFDTVVNAVKEETPLQAFIDARGGCGKTFTLNAILAAVRSLKPGGCVALAMATTGIAANLLTLGRTFHSRMKAPLTPTEESMFNITGQSTLAELIRMAKLLIIDEATMLHRYQLEAMDRTLRDIMGNDLPFGGKVLLLSGDFRQCLPVVPGASRAGTVDTCLNRSLLWNKFTVLKLTENMRVRASGDATLIAFDKWLLSLGDGTAPVDGNGMVELPEEQCVTIDKDNEDKSMREFCQKIFPNLNENISDENWLKGRKVLAPTNKEVDKINNLMVDKMAGDLITLHSSDSLDNDRDVYRYNIEYINTLNPSGLPASRLCLKPGMPVMLMRNLNPTEGLCNGTQMIFKKMLSPRLMVCRTVGQEVDRDVYIPRITLRPKEKQYPFEWSRRQFPIKAAFSTTINKSQGQTMKVVGVWLTEPVFSHGQLYVAGSRVGAPERLWFAVRPENDGNRNHTRNIVYLEVLTDPAVQPRERQEDEEMANFDLQFLTPVEAADMPDYEADDAVANFDLELEEEVVSGPSHRYDLRPREKRSCSPARMAAPPPRTVPR